MSKKIVKAAKAVAKKSEKKRIRKPRTEAQKARRRELDAIRRAEAKKHAKPKKTEAKKDFATVVDYRVAKAINAFGQAMSAAWTKLLKALD